MIVKRGVGVEVFKIKEVSEKINAGESTVRFWRDRYETFIPTIGKGRKRRYTAEGVEVLRLIAELSKEGLSKTEINDILSGDGNIVADPEPIEVKDMPLIDEDKITSLIKESIDENIHPVINNLLNRITNLEALLEKNINIVAMQQKQQLQQQEQIKKTTSNCTQKEQIVEGKEILIKQLQQLPTTEKDKILFDIIDEFGENRQRCADVLNERGIPCGKDGGLWTRKKVNSNLGHAKERAKNKNYISSKIL